MTIDAAFVEFVHRESLKLRIWTGGQGEWPNGGTACGVAKVALRPLLTTLSGVSADAISVSTDVGGDRNGTIAIRLYFRHRRLSSDERSPAEKNERAEYRGEKDTAADNNAERAGRQSTTCPELQPEALSKAESSPSSAAHLGDLDICEFDAAPSGGSDVEQSSVARHETEELTERRQRGVSGGKLHICVERAMRLLPSESASRTLVTSSPSTYVTFRWEERGNPLRRSPFVFHPTASARSSPGSGGSWEV